MLGIANCKLQMHMNRRQHTPLAQTLQAAVIVYACLRVPCALGPADLGPCSAQAGEPKPAQPSAQVPRFDTDVRPIFQAHCTRCHGEKPRKAGLDLTNLEGVMQGSESDPVIVPGNPLESLLFQVVHRGKMPPKKKGLLCRAEIQTIRGWIQAGAPASRLPIAELPPDKNASHAGRGHGPHGFTVWMAGGGVKGGVAYGNTDDFSFAAVENRASVTDWHATILHLLGLHHDRLFFNRTGFKERLTSTFPARVVKEV
jgi:hypothetical protein